MSRDLHTIGQEENVLISGGTIVLFFLVLSCACDNPPSVTDIDKMSADSDAINMDAVDNIEFDGAIEPDDAIDVPDEMLDDAPIVSDYDGVDCDPWVPDGDPYADIESAAMKWYGDFDVVATDPDNIRELWKGIYRYSTDSPDPRLVKPYDRCVKDYPFEPAMVEDEPNAIPSSWCSEEDRKSTIRMFSCDTLIAPGRCWYTNWWYAKNPVWQENGGVFVSNLRNLGKTFFVQAEGGYLFDISKRQMIRFSGQIDGESLSTNGKHVFFATYDNGLQYNYPEKPSYYADGNARFLFSYYDTNNRTYGIAYKQGLLGAITDVASNEKYVIMTVQEELNISGTKVLYTKIGEWDNWQQLRVHPDPKSDRVGLPSLHDHYVAFYNWDFVIQYCDLDIGTESCEIISRYGEVEGKYNRDAVISRDGKRIYYSEGSDGYQNRATTIVEADITDMNHISYREIASHDKVLAVTDIDSRFLLFAKESGIDTSNESELPFYVACFYRFSDDKIFCLENDHDSDTSSPLSKPFSMIWEKYLIYTSGAPVLRDMECYCNAYPDTCPYEEYAPVQRGWKNLFGLIR